MSSETATTGSPSASRNTAPGCLEEPLGELLPPLARRLEARRAVLHVAAGAYGDLPAVVLALAHNFGDLVVPVGEHLAQKEHRALDRGEVLEEQQERGEHPVVHRTTHRRTVRA